MSITLKLAVVLLLAYGGHALALEQLESHEGYFVLSFDDYSKNYDVLEIFQLRKNDSDDKAFTGQTFNITGQRQATLSGFADGIYQARLVDSQGNKAPVLIAEVYVQHRSLTQALILFGIGLMAFILLTGLLLRFNRSETDHA
jgi:hypothetical protein